MPQVEIAMYQVAWFEDLETFPIGSVTHNEIKE
jgi:hypothetical protein